MSETTLPDPAALPPHRVAVVVPTLRGCVYALERWNFEQARDAPVVTVSVLHHMVSGYHDDMRQALADGFLRGCTAEWLLMIDDDTVPRLSALQIVQGAEAAGVKITVAPVPIHGRLGGMLANVKGIAPDQTIMDMPWHKLPWQQKERFWPIYTAGLACALIHRSVLEVMIDDAVKGRAPWPFRAVWKDGRVVQEGDMSFLIRARQRGFQAYCDLDNPCSHVKYWTMTPQQAINDLPFHEPGVSPNPRAPHDYPMAMRQPAFTMGSDVPSKAIN